MKSYFNFLFLVLFFSIFPLINAAGFSPTSLTFNSVVDEEQCQIISLSSDSKEISVSDVWKDDFEDEWKLSSMNSESSDYGLELNYPELLELEDREVEVCVSGSKEGEYHGAIILRESQEGNSVLQFVVWLKLNIQERKTESIQSDSGAGSSRSSSSSSSDNIPEEKNVTENKNAFFENTTLPESRKESGFSITGNVVNDFGGNNTTMLFKVGIILILFLAIFAIYKKRRKNNE